LIEVQAYALEDVSGIFRLGAELPGNGIDKSLITGNELIPGVLLSPKASVNQVSVPRCHSGSILTAKPLLHAEKSGDSTDFACSSDIRNVEN